jgi:predicted lipoprotein with Yx(FWY)xxD motif
MQLTSRTLRWVLPLLLFVPLGVGAATAATSAGSSSKGTVSVVKSKTFGTILVGASGRTLYRYTVDRPRTNRCTADPACNPYWPPLLIKAGAKATAGTGVKAAKLGTIKAKNGMRQVTYAGWPLYYFAGDKKAGQTSGQAFEKEWYVVNTGGALVKHALTTAPGTTPATTTTGGGGYAWG